MNQAVEFIGGHPGPYVGRCDCGYETPLCSWRESVLSYLLDHAQGQHRREAAYEKAASL